MLLFLLLVQAIIFANADPPTAAECIQAMKGQKALNPALQFDIYDPFIQHPGEAQPFEAVLFLLKAMTNSQKHFSTDKTQIVCSGAYTAGQDPEILQFMQLFGNKPALYKNGEENCAETLSAKVAKKEQNQLSPEEESRVKTAVDNEFAQRTGDLRRSIDNKKEEIQTNKDNTKTKNQFRRDLYNPKPERRQAKLDVVDLKFVKRPKLQDEHTQLQTQQNGLEREKANRMREKKNALRAELRSYTNFNIPHVCSEDKLMNSHWDAPIPIISLAKPCSTSQLSCINYRHREAETSGRCLFHFESMLDLNADGEVVHGLFQNHGVFFDSINQDTLNKCKNQNKKSWNTAMILGNLAVELNANVVNQAFVAAYNELAGVVNPQATPAGKALRKMRDPVKVFDVKDPALEKNNICKPISAEIR